MISGECRYLTFRVDNRSIAREVGIGFALGQIDSARRSRRGVIDPIQAKVWEGVMECRLR